MTAGTAPSARPRRGTWRSTWRSAVRRSPARLVGTLVVNILVAVSLLAFLLIALGPHLFGYRTQTMLTEQHGPGHQPG